MKVLNLVLIVGVSQVFIACATPRDLEENKAQKSGAESGQVAAPKAKMPVESVQTGLVPQKEQTPSEDLSASEKERLKRADEKAALEEKRHQEKMELEHARIKSFEASQAQFYDYLRDSAEKQQLVQIGMMATLSQLFPKTESAGLSFDEDCFIERIHGLEAALRKAQEQINERNDAGSTEENGEVLIEVAEAVDQVPYLLARPEEDEGVNGVETQVSTVEIVSAEPTAEEAKRPPQVTFVRSPSLGSLWSSNKSSK